MVLRHQQFLNRSSVELQTKFNFRLDPKIGIDNVFVVSSLNTADTLTVKSVEIVNSVIRIITLPQTSLANYYIEFKSTNGQKFTDATGTEDLIEDNVNNRIYFLGLESDNSSKNDLLESMPPVYDIEGNTLVRKHIINIGEAFFRAKVDIQETANANFIQEIVKNEIKQRGASSKDRLALESAYQVDRVSLAPEGAPTTTKTLSFLSNATTNLLGSNALLANQLINKFPIEPISLQETSVDEIVSNEERLLNKFQSLYLTLSKKNIIRVNSLTLVKGGVEYVYDIPTYKYALLDNKYDKSAFKLLTLDSNQIKLSEAAVLNDNFPEPSGADQIFINYTYKNLGIDIDTTSIYLYSIFSVAREQLPSLTNVFSLKHFPIVSANDKLIISSGVSFMDPAPINGLPYNVKHKAFLNEVTYTPNRLPNSPGEYTVDYASGKVFCFGADANGNGTESTPPVASYTYRKVYVENIDYVFDSEAKDMVAVATRDLAGSQVKLDFDYNIVLVPDVDYVAEVHNEVIDEYIDNRIINDNILLPLKFPITNVLKVINETSGEQYRVIRSTDRAIYIDGSKLPRIGNINNEPAEFLIADKEELFISEILSSALTQQIVKVELLNSFIGSYTGRYVGDNTNTSLSFSDANIFIKEFFYDDVLQTLSQNLIKLSNIGDYVVDYKMGNIYLVTAINESFELGYATYSHFQIRTGNDNIVAVNDIFYKLSNNLGPVKTIDFSSFAFDNISIKDAPHSLERFLQDDTNKVILLGAKQYGLLGQWTQGTSIFSAPDGHFTTEHADGYHFLRLVGDADRSIISIINEHNVIVDFPFTSKEIDVSWCLVDGNPIFPSLIDDGYKTITSYDIKAIRGIYLIDELQTMPFDSIVNYWDPAQDTFSGNLVKFKNSLIQTVPIGTALAIDYDYGTLFTAYTYLQDNIRISYEWGDNQLKFLNDALIEDDEYYVTYRYGALRDSLISNFASLTQIPELTNLGINFDRELLRDTILGTMSSFASGPTKASISSMVNHVTEINPIINELTFNEWTTSRDNLYLNNGNISEDPSFTLMRYGAGLLFDKDLKLSFPEESYVSYREGTFEGWLKPKWAGIDNDAKLTFTLTEDGYALGKHPDRVDGYGLKDGYQIELSDVYIGAMGFNPTSNIFELTKFDLEPHSPIGMPVNFADNPGYYIWLDIDSNSWVTRFLSYTSVGFHSDITSTGELYRIVDGYSDNFSFLGLDGYLDGYFLQDGLEFSSDNEHYIFDAGVSNSHNRLSLYKDSFGYLNFRAYDSLGQKYKNKARFYSLSNNIQHWKNDELHFVAASWRFNTAEGRDEMHLFIDGQEVSNLYKYGGKPESGPTNIFRTTAEEIISSNLPYNIRNGTDGITVGGSPIFSAASASFISDGILVGATFYILDSTLDGVMSPFTVLSINSETSLTMTSNFSLSLENVRYSVNTLSFNVSTNAGTEEVAIYTYDGYSTYKELNGVDSLVPDYSIFRVGGENVIRLEGHGNSGDTLSIVTLGLTKGRNRGIIYKYSDDQYIDTRFAPPAATNNFDLYKIPFIRTSIANGETSESADGYFTQIGLTISGNFTNLCQPSNNVKGKKYKLTLHGAENIDFSGTNQATINGTTFAGPTSEVITFSAFGSLITTNYFKSTNSISFVFTGYDGYSPYGAIEIIESISLTESENNGNYAQLLDYDNGQFEFILYGSGGIPFILESCHYLLDYPIALDISLNSKHKLFIGSDLYGQKSLEGGLEQIIFLNEMLSDVRVGEDLSAHRSVTSDYNSPIKLEATAQTLMLLDLDNHLINRAGFYKTFDERFVTSSQSVNPTFGDALVLNDRKELYRIDNGAEVFRNNRGTTEFWISPLLDIYNDQDSTRFFMDITSSKLESNVSLTKKNIKLTAKARRINSISIVGDANRVDYFANGKLALDGLSITLGKNLPKVHTNLVIDYVPSDFQGNRMSIYKDGYNMLNFAIAANDATYIISNPIEWKRDTWHRILATWDLNNPNNADRMRLFVDGMEGGTIVWGSPGLLYGTGVIWGSAMAGTGSADFLTADINFTDTFGEVVLGNSYDGHYPGFIKMDNLRFSFNIRAPAVISGINLDLNYNSNLDAVTPVINDAFTSGLFDFDRSAQSTQFLSNLLSKYSPLFKFDVNVDDGFKKVVGSELAKKVLRAILNRIRPAHTNILTKFLQEDL